MMTLCNELMRVIVCCVCDKKMNTLAVCGGLGCVECPTEKISLLFEPKSFFRRLYSFSTHSIISHLFGAGTINLAIFFSEKSNSKWCTPGSLCSL